MKKEKYKVVDLLEVKETIGYANSISEVKNLARHWLENVSEEAAIYYYPLNEEKGKYDFEKGSFWKHVSSVG